MKLKCSLCSDENVYEVRNVYVSSEKEDPSTIIGDDLECLSCGKIAEMELTGEGYMALMAELVKLGASNDGGEGSESPIKYVSSRLADGTVTSIGKSIEIYEEKLRHDPDNPEYLISLGNIYRHVNKKQAAERYYSRCIAVNPHCAEAWWALANVQESSGNFSEAFRYLEEGLNYRDSWRFYRLTKETPDEFGNKYCQTYNNLRTVLGIGDEPHPSSAKRSKIGRNEPCPCGSGKKYKKCCIGT